MSEDLISRRAAIDAIRQVTIHAEDESLAVEALEKLSSAQQWIPVTERLPEVNGDYLVTGRQGAVNKRRYDDGHWYGNWAVIAWMPLPEAYREGGAEDA